MRLPFIYRKTFQAFQSPRLTQWRNFHATRIAAINFDPYKTLGVDKGADAKTIKKAYIQLVKKYHPDVNKEKDAQQRFHKIQESYELLNDKEKKAQYDQFGASAFDENGNSNPYAGGNPFGGAGNPFGGAAGGFGFNFEDLFKEGFARAQGGQGRGGGFMMEHVGDDVEVLKSISFKEAIFGTKVKINYKAVESCSSCKGTGLKTGKKKNTCPTCHGTGQATHYMGGFHMASTCGTCQGTGVTIAPSDQCRTCHAQGVEEVARSQDVDLPAGVKDGTRLRVPGAGDAPIVTKDGYNVTRKGDLIIRVNVRPDNTFKREGNNIVVNSDILMTTAALGGEIVIPTVDGPSIKLKVRPGAQSGSSLIVPERGVPINRNVNNRGDMKVNLQVKTLVPETPMQTALLEALADAFNDKNAKRNDAHWKLDIEEEDKSEGAKDGSSRIGKFLSKFFNMDKKQ